MPKASAVLLLLATLAIACGQAPHPYSPQRPGAAGTGAVTQNVAPPPPRTSDWLPDPDLLGMAAEHPPRALARLDALFARLAMSRQPGAGWSQTELELRADSIKTALSGLGLDGQSVLRQRWGSLSEQEAERFRRASDLMMRWALAQMATGDVNECVAGAEKLRQALDWKPDDTLLSLLLAGYYDLAGFKSLGNRQLEDRLRQTGHDDLVVLQLLRRHARNWVVTREPAELDTAFALCGRLAAVHGGWGEVPGWLHLERARLHHLRDNGDSAWTSAESALARAEQSDPWTAAQALLLMGTCKTREMEFEAAELLLRRGLIIAAREPGLEELAAWMLVPWDLWSESRQLEFDGSSDRMALIHEFWQGADPILATPDVLEQRIEYERRVAECWFTLSGVDPALPGPMTEAGRAILRFGWPRAWISRGGQRKKAAEGNPLILAGIDRAWRFAYRFEGVSGARPDTILFQDGGSGSRFLPVDSLVAPSYPDFSFDLDFNGRSYLYHVRTTRFLDARRRLVLLVSLDTLVPDYTLRYPLNGLVFEGTMEASAALYGRMADRRQLAAVAEIPLEQVRTLPGRRRLVRRSGTTLIRDVKPGVASVATQLVIRDRDQRILFLGVDNGRPAALDSISSERFDASDLLFVESFPDLPPAETEWRVARGLRAFGNDLAADSLTPRACPLYLPEESVSFYLEAYNLAEEEGRTLAELAFAVERLDPEGEVEYAIEIGGRDQVLQRTDIQQWHILRSVALSQLTPGSYRIRATVTDHLADARLVRIAPFWIEDEEQLVDLWGMRDWELPERILSAAPAAR